jgi:DNA polymerase-3 subunit delta'
MKQWELLKKMVKLGRVPHALLFSGSSPEKRKIALEFIKLVNGGHVKEGHPDLYIIGPQDGKEIKISQIRELHSKLSLKSYSASFKSVIIDKAHTLNQEAQSAFLKLLEEPKGQTLFILITNFPEFLLPTILSRVEHLKFYSALPVLTDSQKRIISEMLQVKRGDLALRFQYAKKLSEDPQSLREILETWLRYFRGILLSGVSTPNTIKTINTIQTINFLLFTTNINPRLALEVLMLEL